MEYLKLKPDLDSDPDFLDAGFWPTRVYELLLKVSAAKDLFGRITPEYQRLSWLLRFWNFTPEDVPEPDKVLKKGIERLKEMGKLVVEGQDWVIKGWERFYKPTKSGAARTRDWRTRRDGCDDGDARDIGDAPNVTVTEVKQQRHGDATHPHTHNTHAQNATSQSAQFREVTIPDLNLHKLSREQDEQRTTELEWLKWAEEQRHRTHPKALPDTPKEHRFFSWFQEVRASGIKPSQLQEAYKAFLRDKWATGLMPPCPWDAWASKWKSFVPGQVASPQSNGPPIKRIGGRPLTPEEIAAAAKGGAA